MIVLLVVDEPTLVARRIVWWLVACAVVRGVALFNVDRDVLLDLSDVDFGLHDLVDLLLDVLVLSPCPLSIVKQAVVLFVRLFAEYIQLWIKQQLVIDQLVLQLIIILRIADAVGDCD